MNRFSKEFITRSKYGDYFILFSVFVLFSIIIYSIFNSSVESQSNKINQQAVDKLVKERSIYTSKQMNEKYVDVNVYDSKGTVIYSREEIPSSKIKIINGILFINNSDINPGDGMFTNMFFIVKPINDKTPINPTSIENSKFRKIK